MEHATAGPAPCEAPSRRLTDLAVQALAERARLRIDNARAVWTPIVRGAEACGLLLSLYGPRRLLLTAILDVESRELWCYDSRGLRYQRVPLADKTGAGD